MAQQGLNDAHISECIREPKRIHGGYPSSFPFKLKGGHNQCDFPVETESGRRYEVKIRQSAKNPLDFSVILVYYPAKSNQGIRLTRYNGKSHEHSNAIEGNRFYDFHIHLTTERYLARQGYEPETYAVVTDKYSDLQSAFRCFAQDCSITFSQGNLL